MSNVVQAHEALADEVFHRGNVTTQIRTDAEKKIIVSVRSVENGIEIVKDNADAWGFRSVSISKPLAGKLLRVDYERVGMHGDYVVVAIELLFKERRYFMQNGTACPTTVVSQAQSILTATASRYAPYIDKTCAPASKEIGSMLNDLSDPANAISICLKGQLPQRDFQSHWAVMTEQSAASPIFKCDKGIQPESKNGTTVQLGNFGVDLRDASKLDEVMLHEMVHFPVNSEVIAEGISRCCSDPHGAGASKACRSLSIVSPLFKTQTHSGYGNAIDAISKGLNSAQQESMLAELTSRLNALHLNSAKTPIAAKTDLQMLNATIIGVCEKFSSANNCANARLWLAKNLTNEVNRCVSPSRSNCALDIVSTGQTENDESHSGVALMRSGSALNTNSTQATNLNLSAAQAVKAANSIGSTAAAVAAANAAINSGESAGAVTYQAVAGESRAAMNTFIATSANSSVELTKIATNTIAPLGSLIESTAQASETAGGGPADYTMAVSQSNSSGTTFSTSSGTTVVTKQHFADIPNATVNAGLWLPKTNTALAQTRAGASGEAARAPVGGVPALSSGGGGSGLSASGTAAAQRNTASVDSAKMPMPKQIQSKRDAFQWLAKIPEPSVLLNQKWFNEKLVDFHTHLSYHNVSYGDQSVKSILAVEKIRKMMEASQ